MDKIRIIKNFTSKCERFVSKLMFGIRFFSEHFSLKTNSTRILKFNINEFLLANKIRKIREIRKAIHLEKKYCK